MAGLPIHGQSNHYFQCAESLQVHEEKSVQGTYGGRLCMQCGFLTRYEVLQNLKVPKPWATALKTMTHVPLIYDFTV